MMGLLVLSRGSQDGLRMVRTRSVICMLPIDFSLAMASRSSAIIRSMIALRLGPTVGCGLVSTLVSLDALLSCALGAVSLVASTAAAEVSESVFLAGSASVFVAAAESSEFELTSVAVGVLAAAM